MLFSYLKPSKGFLKYFFNSFLWPSRYYIIFLANLTSWACLVDQVVKNRLQFRRPGFDPWVGKIPWRGTWHLTPVFLFGESLWTEEPGGLQRVGHATEQLRPCTHNITSNNFPIFSLCSTHTAKFTYVGWASSLWTCSSFYLSDHSSDLYLVASFSSFRTKKVSYCFLSGLSQTHSPSSKVHPLPSRYSLLLHWLTWFTVFIFANWFTSILPVSSSKLPSWDRQLLRENKNHGDLCLA